MRFESISVLTAFCEYAPLVRSQVSVEQKAGYVKMKDICVPIPGLEEQQGVEVEVRVEGEKRRFSFRVESFPWETNAELLAEKERIPVSELRVHTLKDMVETYDQNWELIQIYNPSPGAKSIQVLFRQKAG